MHSHHVEYGLKKSTKDSGLVHLKSICFPAKDNIAIIYKEYGSPNDLAHYYDKAKKRKLLYWRNGLNKNRVGR